MLGKIALGPAAANTVGIYGAAAVPERNRLFCSNLHTPWLTVIDTRARAFVGTVRLEEREQRGLMEMGAIREPAGSGETGAGVTAVDEARNRLYVHGVRGLAVVNTSTLERVAFLPLEAEPGGEPAEVRSLYSVDLACRRVYAARNLMLGGNELEIYEAPQ